MAVDVRARTRRTLVRGLTLLGGPRPLRPLSNLGMRLLFDRLADDWEKIREEPIYRASLERGLAGIRERCPDAPWPPQRALDVACGTGMAAAMLAERFPATDVVGIDIAPRMVALARRQVPAATFLVGSGTALDFPDAAFELVVSVDGVFDVGELARACAPHGVVLIVYSRGGEIPIRRPLPELAAEFERAGMRCEYEQDESWLLWAQHPPVRTGAAPARASGADVGDGA